LSCLLFVITFFLFFLFSAPDHSVDKTEKECRADKNNSAGRDKTNKKFKEIFEFPGNNKHLYPKEEDKTRQKTDDDVFNPPHYNHSFNLFKIISSETV
jgi:hypothetical protein